MAQVKADSRRIAGVVVASVSAFAQLACTTTLYEGPRISPSVAATIDSGDDTVIKEIDGKDVTGGRSPSYLVPPGPHLLRVGTSNDPTSDAEVCLLGDRGRRYRMDSSLTVVELNDDRRGRPVVTTRVPIDCVPERLFPDRPDVGTASVKEDIVQLWSSVAIAPHVGRHPVLDLSFDMSLAWGGDEVAWARRTDGTNDSIRAGTGFLMSVNAMLTPLWFSDVIGFGLAGELGFKVWDITADNGQITFKRYPAIATVHTAVRLDEDLFLILAGGVEKDLGVELSGTGIAAGLGGTATSNVAPIWRLMLYGRVSQRWASLFGVTVSSVKYSVPGASLDASSIGLTLGLALAL